MNVNSVPAYVPSADNSEEDGQTFNRRSLEQALSPTKSCEVKFILCDFNAKFRNEKVKDAVWEKEMSKGLTEEINRTG